jgi:hypothetical protein
MAEGRRMFALNFFLYSVPRLAGILDSHSLLASPHEWLETSKIVRNGGFGAFVCAVVGGFIGGANADEKDRFEGVTMGALLGVIVGALFGVFALGPTLE